MENLLTREQFREFSFKRDKNTCVFCNKPSVDPHHMDRKLFKNGGYYLNNCASVCEYHHWEVEKTNITVKDVRIAAKITTIILPEGFEISKEYDKWGNVILTNGRRLPGPMFLEENVQKILKDKIWLFD